jgi:putative component of membrane protein insertase Oxa1/YidC/SpoIIIJ protein YidD
VTATRRARAAVAALSALATAACTSGVDAGDSAIGFYQRHLGSQWAFHCKFQPSCSNYGKQSIDLYGLIPGTLMTADRLMRDHDLCYWRYAADDRGHPLDPPRENALFGPRVLDADEQAQADAREAAATDADAQQAQEQPPLGPEVGDDEQIAFADKLFEGGEWERAHVEYARLVFHRPATPHAQRCHQRSAVCLAHLGRRAAALAEADRIAAERARVETRALVLRALDQPIGAWKEAGGERESGEAGDLLTGLLALEADQTVSARQRFGRLDPPLRDPLLERVAEYEALPSKSRWLAGSLSAVLPGAGQLYAGRPEDAAVAFFTNAVLIGATAYAWHQHERATAGALGFVAFGFYVGNIYGGVNAAEKHDRALQQGAIGRTRSWLGRSNLWIGVTPERDGGALGIVLGF